MGYIDEAASLPALRAALESASQNRGGPGPDGVSVAAFSAEAGVELERLRAELLTGAYHPRPSRRVSLPKPGGGHRDLAVGCVRDRVVQHALARTLSDRLDDVIHPSAYAWRRGRSAKQCLAAVDAALADGSHWVFRGDVESFFDRIPVDLLLGALHEHTRDEALVTLVGRLLRAGTLVGGDVLDPPLGTGQGSPLSPFLANLYLLPFDRAVEAAGHTLLRYGDDLCAPTPSRADAERALDTVARALERLRLYLNAGKVAIRHLGEGFAFLGFAFHPGGRRAGPRAVKALLGRIEEAQRERPAGDHQEVDEALRAWLTYYGSLAGVPLPKVVQARAEVLEAAATEARQFGGGGGARGPAPPRPRPAADRGPPSPVATRAPGERSGRWGEAAVILHGARGTPEEAEALQALADELAVDRAAAVPLAEALRRFDGAAAAEALARLGRYEDADAATSLAPPADLRAPAAPFPRGLPVEPAEQAEPPRLQPRPEDRERLLALFGGAEHTFLRDVSVGERVERQRVNVAPTVEHLRAHLDGAFWMGIYPLRANNCTRWAAFRIVQAARLRRELRGAALADAVIGDGRALLATLSGMGITPAVSVEPGRAMVLWVLFAEAITAARARSLMALVAQRAGAPDPTVTRETFPVQEVVKPDKPGSAVLLPLGRDPRSGERAWFLDATLAPAPDACGYLRAIEPVGAEAVAAALGVRSRVVPAPPAPGRSAPAAAAAGSTAAVAADVVAVETSPLRELPRAQEVYRGCAVFRHLADQAISGAGLSTGDRLLIADVVGRLGQESAPAAEAVFRHLDDYKPGMGARMLQRIYPHPTSCGRIRQRMPELTARVGCDCRFRVPPGAYPTPVLHALGAAEVPGMAERVRETAARGGLARAAMAAMNEGRKELGAKAAALCARLSDLRRQARVLEKTIAGVEAELDAVVDEAGEGELETPAGTLRRVVEGGRRRFVLEV